MFGFGFIELLFVLFVAFLVLGPKKMLRFAEELGKWFSQFKQELKHLKEIEFPEYDTQSFEKPEIELNKSLEQIKKN